MFSRKNASRAIEEDSGSVGRGIIILPILPTQSIRFRNNCEETFAITLQKRNVTSIRCERVYPPLGQ